MAGRLYRRLDSPRSCHRRLALRACSAAAILALATQLPAAGPPDVPLPARADAATFALLRSLYGYDRTLPLDTITYPQDFCASLGRVPFTQEKLIFRGVWNVRLPAYLSIPDSAEGPVSLVLLLHGGDGAKSDYRDIPEWGRWDAEHPAKAHTYAAIVMQWVVEHRRFLDVLASRADIDTTRIAVGGAARTGGGPGDRADPAPGGSAAALRLAAGPAACAAGRRHARRHLPSGRGAAAARPGRQRREGVDHG